MPPSCPRALPTDGDFKDIQGSRGAEQAGNLNVLEQVLFGGQLLKEAVLRPYLKLCGPAEVAPRGGVVDRMHIHHYLPLLVRELIERLFVGLRLADFIQTTPPTDHGALDMQQSSSRHLPLYACSDAGQQQGRCHACSECFPESR